MKVKAVLAAVLLVLIAALVAKDDKPSAGDSHVEVGPQVKELVSYEAGGAAPTGGFGAGQAHYVADYPNYRAHTALFGNSRGFSFNTEEQDPVSGVWYETKLEYSVSFSIKRTAHVTSHTLVFGGNGPRGADIIESFLIPVGSGVLYSNRPGNLYPSDCQPPGSSGGPTPIGSFPAVVVESGPVFLIPSQRVDPGPPGRCQVYTGDLDGIVDLDADPNGRYVLVLGGEQRTNGRKLYQVGLYAGATPVEILSDVQIPGLLLAEWVAIKENVTNGRVVQMGYLGVSDFMTIVGVDSDNDGVFESFTEYDSSSFVAAGYGYGTYIDL